MITTQALIEKFRYALDNKWGYIWGTAGEKWTETKQKELNLTQDSDRAQGRKYGSRWIGHYVADCSGLFSWAFKKLGGQMYHGSDTMYKKWCVNKGELKKGKRTDNATLKPGTAVFVWNGSKYTHVGLYVGGETVIEAKGTINGVVTTPVTESKWTHWGELTGVDYENNVNQGFPEKTGWHPTVRRGMKGDDVRELQSKLDKLGYNLGSYGVDGDFGRATEAAVKEFQEDHKLTVDGVCGPMTWDALDKAVENVTSKPKPKYYTVSIHGLDKTQADALITKYPGATCTEE